MNFFYEINCVSRTQKHRVLFLFSNIRVRLMGLYQSLVLMQPLNRIPDYPHRNGKKLNKCLFRSHSYYKLIPELVSAGFRVVVLDFIGFGRSDKLTDWRTYSLELHKSTVEQLLRHLQLMPFQNNPYQGHYHNKLTLVKGEKSQLCSRAAK